CSRKMAAKPQACQLGSSPIGRPDWRWAPALVQSGRRRHQRKLPKTAWMQARTLQSSYPISGASCVQPAMVPSFLMQTEKATFGAGCFWGVEETFRTLKGVVSTAVGYAGGAKENPTYEDVCSDKTGHAEVVEVEFDPSQISYAELLDVFWSNHNPTTMNRPGPDGGVQY